MIPYLRRRRLAAPYVIPGAAPYNVPQHAVTPTYDGSDNVVHPDVIDFKVSHQRARWHGYRFWMASTPYPNGNDDYENPSILASNDGLAWEVPPGLTNPVYPMPASGWNSDTDLSYDPVSDQLVLVYRNQAFVPQVARSADGVTWPASATPVAWDAPTEESASPALVRAQDGTWLMFGISYPSRLLLRWSAPTPEGPWTQLANGAGLGSTAWHLDVCRIGTRLLAIIDDGMENAPEDGIYAATSPDGGATWSRNPARLISRGSGKWDNADLYRASLQRHENGSHMRVWYCGRRGTGPVDSWHVGLTHIPLTEWPAPA